MGFHQDNTVPAGSVLLNICWSSVFHFVLHYSEEDKDNTKSDEGNMDKSGNGKMEIDKDTNSKNNDAATSQKWQQQKAEKNVEPLNYILNVTVLKFPLIGRQGYATHNVKVMFAVLDPDIMYYPTYQIGEAVYIGDKSHRELVYDYLSEPYKGYDAYPSYQLLFPTDGGTGTFLWFPFFEVAHSREHDCPIYTISDLVQFYGEEPGKDEAGEDGNKVKGQSGKAGYNNNGNSSSHSSCGSTPSSGNSSSHFSSNSTLCQATQPTREAYLVYTATSRRARTNNNIYQPTPSHEINV
eukprot:jgi/Psemu1/16262/gm1.16262_g